jgi:hypothetical protein
MDAYPLYSDFYVPNFLPSWADYPPFSQNRRKIALHLWQTQGAAEWEKGSVQILSERLAERGSIDDISG